MSKKNRLAHSVDAPIGLALVFVCEKCGKRAGGSGKNPSHQLASRIKRLGKEEFERGQVRAVLTSCLDLCPEEHVAMVIVPAAGEKPSQFLEVAIEDIEASGAAVIAAVRRLT